MSNRPSWDDTFIELCSVISKRSKDQNTKLGCVIVGPSKEVRSLGYNCFPRGCNDEIPARQLRPAKYLYIEHCERNAVYNAARMGVSLLNCTCYISGIPCADCARALIQSGITEVVCKSNIIPLRFKDSCEAAITMLLESGVKIRLANKTENLSIELGDEWGK